jgi:ABC-type multidrug transport system ATPase subunit
VFIPTLSVWETIEITAKLRLPGGIASQDRRALIHDSLRSMGLQKLLSRQASGP